MSFADDDQETAEVDDLQKLQFRKDSKHHDTMVVSSSKHPDYEKERKKEQPSVKVNQGKGCDPFSDSQSVPIVAEKLLTYIEEHGLYVEDIYLKFADKKKIEELRQRLDRDIEAVDLMAYSIHVVCNVFILWLKYLPNPIIPVRYYKRFVRAMGLQQWRERVRMVYSLINQLPSCNLNTLERIILHLVRIAQKERTNYMTPKMLSIVFGRCLLQCKNKDKPETVQEIGRTIAVKGDRNGKVILFQTLRDHLSVTCLMIPGLHIILHHRTVLSSRSQKRKKTGLQKQIQSRWPPNHLRCQPKRPKI